MTLLQKAESDAQSERKEPHLPHKAINLIAQDDRMGFSAYATGYARVSVKVDMHDG